jgi:hypothetical protein
MCKEARRFSTPLALLPLRKKEWALKFVRFDQNPIITPNMDARMGDNINGPSLIRVPDWLENPLGRYYLYFAHHQGKYIRLAYADRLEGPWTTHGPGTLQLEETPFLRHVASPDVHVDDETRQIRIYCHGPVPGGGQRSRVALSEDGLYFTCHPEILGSSYMRVFQWGGAYHALGMPGHFYRSADGLTDFEQGPTLFTRDMRHAAVQVDGDVLSVFYSNAHDCPERILMSQIALTPDWMNWTASEPVTVIEPETEYEGVNLPLEPSNRGWSPVPVRQLRDPGFYREGDKTYLLYSVAGEQGIAIAEMIA